jgi:hypothetical protein
MASFYQNPGLWLFVVQNQLQETSMYKMQLEADDAKCLPRLVIQMIKEQIRTTADPFPYTRVENE